MSSRKTSRTGCSTSSRTNQPGDDGNCSMPTIAQARARWTGIRRGASQHKAARVDRVGCTRFLAWALVIRRSTLKATAAASVRG